MKKIISIGVALAVLAMVVLPVGVAADDPPPTYAKIPFTIMGESLTLIGDLIASLDAKMDLGLPLDVSQVTAPIAVFIQGPLSYTVDLLAWGLEVLEQILGTLLTAFDMTDYMWMADVVTDIACKLYTPFGNVTGPAFDPCA